MADWALRRMTGASLILSAIIVAAPVVATPSTDGDDPALQSSGLIDVSPVVGRGYDLQASVRTVSDSNFRRTNPGEAGVRVSPLVSAGLGLPVGRQQLFIGGDVGRDIVIDKSAFNRNRYLIGGGLNWRLGVRCSGSLVSQYSSRLSTLSDQATFVPNVQDNFVTGGSLTCQSPVGFGFGGTVRHSEIRNELAQRKAFDVNSTTYSPSLSYSLPALGRFSLGGSINDVEYPGRIVTAVTGPVNDRVRFLSARLGFERQLGSRLQVSLGLSYIKVKPKPDATLVPDGLGNVFLVPRAGYSGGGYDAGIAYKPSPRLSFQFSAAQSATVSANVGSLFIVDRQFGVDATYKLGSSLTAGLGVTRNERNYRSSFATLVEPQRRVSDRVDRVYAQIGYQPVKLYYIGIEVAHQQRHSVPDLYNYTSTTAALTLRVDLGRSS